MKKQTKTILGVAALLGVGYFIYTKSKKSNFLNANGLRYRPSCPCIAGTKGYYMVKSTDRNGKTYDALLGIRCADDRNTYTSPGGGTTPSTCTSYHTNYLPSANPPKQPRAGASDKR